MSKHTQGPWQYVFEGGTTAFITKADGSTIICIRTTENTTAHKNLAANVRLIAAAPDLLEALKEARRAIGDHHAPNDCYATGPLTGNSRRDLVECPACSAILKYDAAIAKAEGNHAG
jgi:hypothetical protein